MGHYFQNNNPLVVLRYQKRNNGCCLPAKRFYKVLVKKVMIFLYSCNVDRKLGICKKET